VSGGATRILLARRASGSDHAAVFEAGGLRIEGGLALRRRVSYASVYGLERTRSWLWVGAGVVPVGLGGRDVPAPQLDAVETELRARIAALPDGDRRLGRLAARRAAQPRFPWLCAALALAFGAALVEGAEGRLALATELLFLLAFGLPAERWLGPRPLLASGAIGAPLAALAFPRAAASLAFQVAPTLCAAWIGLGAFARLRREAQLPVLARSAFDWMAPVALAFAVYGLASHASLPGLGLAALAGFAVGPLVLRSTPP
jgi:hypothetical protein